MSVKDSKPNSLRNYRTNYLHTRKKYNRKGKNFYDSKKKNYDEERETSPIIDNMNNQEKEADNPEVDLLYEDEYQGLMHQPRNPILDNSYYYIEREYTEEYNNFKTKWKTEICRYWEMYGECKYGDSCAFAHGDSELKKRKMTFNYKTKPCKQFFELGYCSYGCRCQFSHKKEGSSKWEKNEIGNSSDNEVSYLKIIKEFLSKDDEISHELVKRPRLMTFEKITSSTLEESEKSKLQLYEDIINIKKYNSNKNNNLKFKLSEDSNYTNVSSDNNNNNNDKESL
jgi:hypothetical protein